VKVTRRAFMTMLGAAAALVGLRTKRTEAAPAEPAEPKPVIWIGHF